jgi:acyl-CoA thioesterase FadM
MRWADLDELSHVNNVVYLDYAHEARTVHVARGELENRRVGAVGVEFLRPLLLSRTPLQVRSVDDGERLVQEVAPATSATPFARVTWAASAPDEEPAPAGGEPFALRVRHSDLGADGLATVTKVFEYAQEARIVSVGRIRGAVSATTARFVVARVDLTVGEGFSWRPEPYPARTVVTHVGRSSFRLTTLFDEGRLGRADAVLVGFDLSTQRSRVLEDEERAVLLEQVSAG